MATTFQIPPSPGTPERLASSLVAQAVKQRTEAAAPRAEAERFAWQQEKRAREQNNAPHAQFWLAVAACIIDRTEQPPVDASEGDAGVRAFHDRRNVGESVHAAAAAAAS